MSKLKPCPFCGGEMTLVSSSVNRKFTFYHKGERSCHFYKLEMDWQTVKSLSEAIRAWNKMANQ